MLYKDKVIEAQDFLKAKVDYAPEIGMILGSGLGSLADEIENKIVIKYEEIPHFPTSTVEGHAGQLVFGDLSGKKVMAMQGRFHYYEGYDMKEVTFPVRVMKLLGVKLMIVTNACGGMDPELYPGALMIINDHLNLTGDNPLMGPNDVEFGPRFPDMSTAYQQKYIELAHNVGKKLDIETKEGVYTAISGPYYFAKAELKMLRFFGGDAIGMSTAPEVIVASHMSMDVLGISCVTDMAIAEDLEPLEHERVVEVANATRPKFIKLVKGIVEEVSL